MNSPARDVRYVVFHTPGPAWAPHLPFFQQEGLQAHVEHYRPWAANGKLALGGPFLHGEGGGMMITAPDADEAEVIAHAQADPCVLNGLLRAEVRKWMVGMQGPATR